MKNSLSHIAFIMDGNNRWSVKKGVSKFQAYDTGAKKLLQLSKIIFENYNTNYITAFALSTHNFKRPTYLVNNIIKVLENNIDNFINIEKANFSIIFKGNLSFLKPSLLKKIKNIENKNNNKKKKLSVLLNYSGKEDILKSFETSIKENKTTKKNFVKNLTLSDLPDPDILIRTGGYNRLSDFCLYNLAFTELFFFNKLWPDFNKKDIETVIAKYLNIKRKFGS